MENKEVYELLAKQFQNPQEVITEIINLRAILNLPKGTEHFLSDLHGEAETFLHILRNASGVIRTKIDLAFGDTLSMKEKNELAALIYYPEKRLEKMRGEETGNKRYADILYRLIEVCKLVAAKYTRSKVRKRCRGITVTLSTNLSICLIIALRSPNIIPKSFRG